MGRSELTSRRWWFLAAAGLTVLIGLGSRQLTGIPAWVGDMLWSTMVFFLLCACFPKTGRRRCGVIALAVSFAVELGQLYHPRWLENIRGTAIGHLVLGSTFSWADLPAYTAGVAAGFVITWLLLPRSTPGPHPAAPGVGFRSAER